jgi:aspartyl-tRNA(Asn)/glutamyl-tRNA(Gln) amidotransferase subunit A
MMGHDPKDSTSADLPVPDFEAMLTGDIRGKVIGIPRNTAWTACPTRSRRSGRRARRC